MTRYRPPAAPSTWRASAITAWPNVWRAWATSDVIGQINKRFEAGEAIAEMAALQREFKIFSPEHGLYDSWLLLNIKASDPAERVRWRNWTERYLRRLASDIAGVKRH